MKNLFEIIQWNGFNTVFNIPIIKGLSASRWTLGTNDQVQIVLFWIYVKVQLCGEKIVAQGKEK